MKWRLYLGRYAGISVFVHWTFLILIGWVFLMHYRMGEGFAAGMMGVAFVVALFGCVTLHEFGHALMAQRYHIHTRDITLYPIGGVASLESIPDKPQQELAVALAGPAVNVVIAVLLWLYMHAAGIYPNLSELQQAGSMTQLPFVFNLFSANLLLVVFNLIPAFPMDGGRVLRALLAFKMPRARATRTAATIGQLLAIGFVFLGFYYNFWLVFIGLFIYLGAEGEARAEETKAGLQGLKVADVLMRRFSVLQPQDPLSKAVALLLDSQEKSFLVMEEGEVKGLLSQKDIIAGLSDHGREAPVETVMKTGFTPLQTGDELSEVLQKFAGESQLLPVFQGQQLAGVLDLENITEYLQIQKAASN